MEINSFQEKLDGWTKEEKFELLEALKEVGSHNIEQIHEYLSYKTKDEIKTALEYYRKKASVSPPPVHRRERRIINVPSLPLCMWAKFLIDLHGFEDLRTDTATALRMIANFESIPAAIYTEKTDFKQLYLILADAMEGKLLPDEDYIMSLLGKYVVETALTSRALNRGSTSFKHILQKSCNPAEADVKAFIKPTVDLELLTLRPLTLKKNYNPLNVPETNLKFSMHD